MRRCTYVLPVLSIHHCPASVAGVVQQAIILLACDIYNIIAEFALHAKESDGIYYYHEYKRMASRFQQSCCNSDQVQERLMPMPPHAPPNPAAVPVLSAP